MKKGKKLLFAIAVTLLSVSVVSAKSYKCEVVDGAYYGQDGKEVDKVQYETECATHSCEIVGDAYFGKNGNEVSKDTFESECDTTVVTELPNTSSSMSPTELIFVLIGAGLILGTTILSISYRRVSDKG